LLHCVGCVHVALRTRRLIILVRREEGTMVGHTYDLIGAVSGRDESEFLIVSAMVGVENEVVFREDSSCAGIEAEVGAGCTEYFVREVRLRHEITLTLGGILVVVCSLLSPHYVL
jgi:hypothetical protein